MDVLFHSTMNPNGYEVGVVPSPGGRETTVGLVRKVGWIWRNNYTYTRHRSKKSATAELILLALGNDRKLSRA